MDAMTLIDQGPLVVSQVTGVIAADHRSRDQHQLPGG